MYECVALISNGNCYTNATVINVMAIVWYKCVFCINDLILTDASFCYEINLPMNTKYGDFTTKAS